MTHRQRMWQRCRDFSTPAGSTAYHYLFLCLHSQSWRWSVPALSQRRLASAQVKVIEETKVELAVRQRLTHRNAGIFPLGVGQRHIIISFFVCTRRAGAGRRRYRKGTCGAAASQRRLWRQAPRRAGAVWRCRRRRGSVGSAACDYFFLCLHPQSRRWPAPLSQRRLWRRRFAEAPVAPGASPTQTKASLHTKEVNGI